jgi:hypothetical protein
MPSTACGESTIDVFIEMKSAGAFAGGTDITRAP